MNNFEKVLLTIITIAIVGVCLATTIKLEQIARQTASNEIQELEVKVYTEGGQPLERGEVIIDIDGNIYTYTLSE